MRQQYFSSSMDYISYLILDHSLETDVTSGQACNRGCRAFWTILNQSICTQTVRRRFFLHLNWSTTFLISRCWCFPKEQRLMAASSSNSNLVSNGQRVPSGFSWFPLMLEEWVAWALKGIAARRLTSEWFNFSFQSLPSVSLFCFFSFFSFSKLAVIRCLPCRGACPTGSVALPQQAGEWSRVCKRVKG